MNLAVILNRRAGTLAADPGGAAAAIGAAFSAAGHRASVSLVEPRDLDRTLARAAADPTLDGVVVGGGDGSLHAGINALFGTAKLYGVLPGGTLNLFARDLGLPMDLAAAAAAVAHGRVIEVDVAEVNGCYFLNRASLGVHPWLLRHRNRQQALRGREKWIALGHAALRAVAREPYVEVDLVCDGRREKIRTHLLMVTNNPSSDSFGPLFHRDRLDGGELAVYIARESGRLALLKLGMTALSSAWNVDRAVQYFLTTEVTVQSRQQQLRLALDGEVVILEPPLHYRIHPASVRLLAPRAST